MFGDFSSIPGARAATLVGLAGCAAGVASAVSGSGGLAIVAGICALTGPLVITAGSPPADDPAPPDSPHLTNSARTSDDATPDQSDGLVGGDYFALAVQQRLMAARRFLRPLSVVQLQVRCANPEPRTVPAPDTTTARLLQYTLRDCDTAYRLGPGHVALLLEDTPEPGAVWAAERIRRQLAETHPDLRSWAGIACYPAHGLDSGDLIDRSHDALLRALDWPQECIEIAAVESLD